MTGVEALDNPLWYRVSELRPRLRAHVRIQRRAARGQVWYLLIDPDSGRFHRVNRAAYEFIGRINGRDNVEQLWRHVHQRLGEAAPSQTEVVEMLAQLADADLISADALPDLAAFLGRRRRRERQQWMAAVNPLAFRLRLFDPTRLLDLLAPLQGLFSGWGLLAWGLWMLLGLFAALPQAGALAHAFATQGLARETLLAMWLAYPLVKGVHELAHGVAVRAYGGQVREMGLTLLMLTPVPYVDASAATQFAERRRRIAVSAAGIMAELAIAVAALFVWQASQDPGVRQVALAVMLLAGLSTVLFNANPLMRFDGYFMLSDAIEQPNLAQESRAVLLGALQRLLGLRHPAGAHRRPGEALGLAAYGLASLGWRVLAGFAVVSWLHESWPVLALGVALMIGWSLLLRPLLQAAGFLLWDARLGGRRVRAWGVAAAGALALVAAIGLAPAPSHTLQQGVVWLGDEAIVRAPVEATLEVISRETGAHVEPGDVIATLANPELLAERETLRARRAQLDVNYYDALLTDPARATGLAAERSALDAQIARLDQRAGELVLRARVAGTLVLPPGHGDPGRHLAQGSEFAYVLTGEAPVVKVAYTEAQAERLRESPGAVGVRLAGRRDEVLPAHLERQTPQARFELPSAVLGSQAGGPIPTDPADAEGRRALQAVHVADVRVEGLRATHIGQRAWVRVTHEGEPLLTQGLRTLRQLFLRSLG